jgi:hypothetical protein
MEHSAEERLIIVVLTLYTAAPPRSETLLLPRLLPSGFVTSLPTALTYTRVYYTVDHKRVVTSANDYQVTTAVSANKLGEFPAW